MIALVLSLILVSCPAIGELTKSHLMALSAVELLATEAQANPDLTIKPVVRQAASSVSFPAMSALDTLSNLIGRTVAASEIDPLFLGRKAVEEHVADRRVSIRSKWRPL